MKTIIIDESLRDQLGSLIRKSGFTIGLLVGRQLPDESKDFIIHVVPAKEPPGRRSYGSLDDLARNSLEDQIAQLSRMLVGGIAVCGLYCVSADNSRKATETLQRLFPEKLSEGRSLSFLHISTQSSQFTCKNGTCKGQAGSVDLKFQSVASRFPTFSSLVKLDLTLDVPAAAAEEADDEEKAEKAFFQKVLAAVKREAQSFEGGVALVAGPAQFGSVPTVAVDFFTGLQPPEASLEDNQPAVKPVRLVGTLALAACVHEKEDEQAGAAALREDLTRGLRERVLLLRDECIAEREQDEDDEEEEEKEVGGRLGDAIQYGGVLQLPRRVFVRWTEEGDGPSMLVSDYLLPGEDEDEAVQRFADLLGDGDRAFVHAESEAPADVASRDAPVRRQPAAVEKPAAAVAVTSSGGETLQASSSSNFLNVGLLLGGLVLLILAVILGGSRQ